MKSGYPKLTTNECLSIISASAGGKSVTHMAMLSRMLHGGIQSTLPPMLAWTDKKPTIAANT